MQGLSLSADKSKLMCAFRNHNKAGVMVLATIDLSVQKADLIEASTDSRLISTKSNGVDKWFSFGEIRCADPHGCIFIVRTLQDSFEIVTRYYRHSSATGSLIARYGVFTATSLFIGSTNHEGNWNNAVSRGMHLITQLSSDDLSVKLNFVLGNTQEAPIFYLWASTISADEKSLFFASD